METQVIKRSYKKEACFFSRSLFQVSVSCVRSAAGNRPARFGADGRVYTRGAVYLLRHWCFVMRQHAAFCEGVQLQQHIQDSTQAREELTSRVEHLTGSLAAADSTAQRLQQQMHDQQQGHAQPSGGAGPPPAMPGIGVSADCVYNASDSSMLGCAHHILGRLRVLVWRERGCNG